MGMHAKNLFSHQMRNQRPSFASKSIGLSPNKSTYGGKSTYNGGFVGSTYGSVAGGDFASRTLLPPPGHRFTGSKTTLTPSDNFNYTVADINGRNLNRTRVMPNIKLVDPASDDDDDGPELFVAQPTDDIPRNKLVEKLARGL